MGNCSIKRRKIGSKMCKTCKKPKCICLNLRVQSIRLKNIKRKYTKQETRSLPYPREPYEDSDAASDFS